MVSVHRLGVYLFCLIGLCAVAACGDGAGPQGRVFFVEPADGAEISGPVRVVMGVEGIEIKPAGEVVEGTGHHHLLINRNFLSAGQVILTDDSHIHFGKGQTETTLDLPPGDYTLTLQFADGLHRSYGERLSATIRVKVLPKS